MNDFRKKFIDLALLLKVVTILFLKISYGFLYDHILKNKTGVFFKLIFMLLIYICLYALYTYEYYLYYVARVEYLKAE